MFAALSTNCESWRPAMEQRHILVFELSVRCTFKDYNHFRWRERMIFPQTQRTQSVYLWSSRQCCFEREFLVIKSPSLYVIRKLKKTGRKWDDVTRHGWREYRNMDDVNTYRNFEFEDLWSISKWKQIWSREKRRILKSITSARWSMKLEKSYYRSRYKIWRDGNVSPESVTKKTDKYFKWRKEVDDVECQNHSCL